MRLRRLIESVPQDVIPLIKALESIGINTVESFLFSSSSALWELLNINGKAQLLTIRSDAKLRDVATAVYTSKQISVSTADAIWETERQEAQDRHWDGFGAGRSMEDLMTGFDGAGCIELAGGKGAGKSLLALHATLRHLLLDPSHCCIWIDSEASFSPQRAVGILRTMGVQDIDSVTRRIQVIPCYDVSTLTGVVMAIQEDLDARRMAEDVQRVDALVISSPVIEPEVSQVPTSQTVEMDIFFELEGKGNKKAMAEDSKKQEKSNRDEVMVGIVVIDSITTLLKPLIDEGTTEANAQSAMALQSLSTLTRTHNLLTILTNSVVPTIFYSATLRTTRTATVTLPSAFGGTTVKPALKTGFEYWSDVTLLIQKEGDVFEDGTNATSKWNGGMRSTQHQEYASQSERGGARRRVVEVVKSRFGPSSTWTTFDISS